ncbi:Hpt domain-containing protein [Bacteroidetes/Chlorobi group bacterium ChocPot_Mid]|nr:MAG: Hpt domain-containing protein [Bacteroidetes/Chlorobi group bacterium ChocPot_Mid]
MKMPEDPFVLELLPEFIETWENDLNNQLPKILQDKDNKELYRFAHTLKGSCFQFGFDDTAQLGIELMGASKEENWDLAKDLETKIRTAFSQMKEFVEANLNK